MWLLSFIVALLVVAPTSSNARPIPTVAITFDNSYTAVSEGREIMRAEGLVGTFFIVPEDIDRTVSREQLMHLIEDGWEIGGYTLVDMVETRKASIRDAYERITWMKKVMTAKGFEMKSLAPRGRAWNAGLANLARDLVDAVAVRSDIINSERYPVVDRHNVRGGGYLSFGDGTTLADFKERLDQLERTGGILIPNVHGIGVADAYTIEKSVLASIVNEIGLRHRAGRIRAVRFRDALTPEYRR